MVHISNTQDMSHDPLDTIVPLVSLHWFLQYHCTSNSELASLSNVNRRWRQITLKYLKDSFKAKVEEAFEIGRDADVDKDTSHTCSTRNMNTSTCSYPSAILQLLLPDMALEIAKRRLASMNSCSPFVSQDSSAFCLAWFHPKGIKLRTIDLSENSYDENENSISSSAGVGVGGTVTDLAASLKHLKQATQRLKSGSVSASGSALKSKQNNNLHLQTVTDEWQGYRNATDVLRPFGYSTAFVKDFLDYAADYTFDTKRLLLTYAPSSSLETDTNGTLRQRVRVRGVLEGETLSKQRRTTFAVRGTTFARPHGYCLCWEETRMLDLQAELEPSNNIEEQRALMRQITLIERRDKRNMVRMRDCLPRTVKSTPSKNPDYQRPFGQIEGRRQRCIQFLNADKDRAVYMRTHPFDCGPIEAPVTVFLVGIATEDGCFVSGLRKKFEVGHMYPHASSDSLVEMSPICLAVETAKSGDQSSSRYDNGSSFRDSNDGDSDDSSEIYQIQTEEMVGDLNCECKIQWKQKYDYDSFDEDEDEDEDGNLESEQSDVKENQMVHGSMGPGRWHIYTAVFDGAKSTIRIDGVEEPIESSMYNSAQDDVPILDGITIGSDHLFDMSLCFGEGSEGEGEGSIAELAYFKGIMDQQDIACFEDYLMEKHGIIHGSTTGLTRHPTSKSELMHSAKTLDKLPTHGRIGNQWQENQWMRDVHSLMVHSPFATSPRGSVPLRVAARHRSVAWHRCCDVTGKPIRVSRIGSKLSTGSSTDF